MGASASACPLPSQPAEYKPHRPRETAFYKLVERHFVEFEHVYPSRYQAEFPILDGFGFWRPIIRDVVEEYLRCGDLHHGFARVRCKDCGHDFLVSFSCKKRCFCPSCHQKRLLIFSERLVVEICAPVPHRQFVFTIPKRFRLYFRYDRSLLGKLCLAAWRTIRKVYAAGLDDEKTMPGVVGSIQTFGELIHWHPHIHMIATDGAFRPNGTFVPLPRTADEPFLKIWEHEIFRLLLTEKLITEEVGAQMKTWRHSGPDVPRRHVRRARHMDVRVAPRPKSRAGSAAMRQRSPRCLPPRRRHSRAREPGSVHRPLPVQHCADDKHDARGWSRVQDGSQRMEEVPALEGDPDAPGDDP